MVILVTLEFLPGLVDAMGLAHLSHSEACRNKGSYCPHFTEVEPLGQRAGKFCILSHSPLCMTVLIRYQQSRGVGSAPGTMLAEGSYPLFQLPVMAYYYMKIYSSLPPSLLSLSHLAQAGLKLSI